MLIRGVACTSVAVQLVQIVLFLRLKGLLKDLVNLNTEEYRLDKIVNIEVEGSAFAVTHTDMTEYCNPRTCTEIANILKVT